MRLLPILHRYLSAVKQQVNFNCVLIGLFYVLSNLTRPVKIGVFVGRFMHHTMCLLTSKLTIFEILVLPIFNFPLTDFSNFVSVFSWIFTFEVKKNLKRQHKVLTKLYPKRPLTSIWEFYGNFQKISSPEHLCVS